MKKMIILFISLCILLAFSGCNASTKDRQPLETISGYKDSSEYNQSLQALDDGMQKFAQVLENGIPDDLTLTVYYMSPAICTWAPLDVDRLLKDSLTKKVVVEREKLEYNENILFSMSSIDYTPTKEDYFDVRMYYVFETESSGKVLEVAMNRLYGPTFVNGIQVEENLIFSYFIEAILLDEF